MRRVTPKIIAGAIAGIAVAGGGGALAASHFASPKQENEAVVEDAAKQLGVQPSDLSAALKKALEDRVDAAVAAGRLPKAEGAELRRRIESGDVPLFAGPGPGFDGRGGFHRDRPFGALDAAASYLGLSETQLDAKLRSGKTLAEVAQAEGKPVDGLVSAMLAALKKHLDADVAAGRLSGAQETSMLADAKSHITDFVNGKRPPFEDGRGFQGGAGASAPAA